MSEERLSFIAQEAKSPLLDEIQVSKTKPNEISRKGGAPLRVLAWIDDMDG
jgi:hypothetical protein